MIGMIPFIKQVVDRDCAKDTGNNGAVILSFALLPKLIAMYQGVLTCHPRKTSESLLVFAIPAYSVSRSEGSGLLSLRNP